MAYSLLHTSISVCIAYLCKIRARVYMNEALSKRIPPRSRLRPREHENDGLNDDDDDDDNGSSSCSDADDDNGDEH